ncbi:MAG: hypothetical protein ACE5KE_08720 [Methanosarcinales archaeon]
MKSQIKDLDKEKVAEYIHLIESIGIVLAGIIYDSQDKVFSEVILRRIDGKTLVQHIPRGTPSVTHKLLYTILQHPKLKNFLIQKLEISPINFGRFLQERNELNGAYGYVEYIRGEKPEKVHLHYGHTLSLYACDRMLVGKSWWPSSVSKFTRETLRLLLEKWHEYLTNCDKERKISEYLDCIMRLLSFYYCLNKEEGKILKEYIVERTKELFKFTQGKDVSLKGVYLDPYKVYLISEFSLLNTENSLEEEISPLCKEIMRSKTTDDGIVTMGAKEDYEGTLAFLCSLTILSEKNKNIAEFFKEEMNKVMRYMYKLNIYEVGKKTLSKNLNEELIFYEGLYCENISYIPSSIPFYLLRLASLIRKRYSLGEYPLPFSEKEAVKIFLLEKV